MSALMKKPPTEVEVRVGNRVLRFHNIPSGKLKPILISLKNYEDTALSWRELAKDRIATAGSEPAYMVRSSRKAAGMTQTQLATLLGMPQSNISQIEKTTRPIGKALAKKLAAVFNRDYRVFL